MSLVFFSRFFVFFLLLTMDSLVKFPLFSYFIEQNTQGGIAIPPDSPDFAWEQLPSENGLVPIRVVWMPNVNGRPGSHFFVKYREKGATQWLETPYEFTDDHVTIYGLKPDTDYEFAAISVDGEHLTESAIQDVQTVESGMCESKPNKSGFSH